MYLGIDILLDRERRPFVAEVNIGLPGGATEIDRANRVAYGRPSDIFDRIEDASRAAYGKSFIAYLQSIPFLASLKAFKLWMDGHGPRPDNIPPALRLEDKWVQYQILKNVVAMPATEPFRPGDRDAAASFLRRFCPAVLKRRVGRGGRGFRLVPDMESLPAPDERDGEDLLQERIESRVAEFVFSVRVLAFGGRCLGMHASLAAGDSSSDGTIAAVETGPRFGLVGPLSDTVHFEERTWEDGIWFPHGSPAYLHTNLYEDDVTRAVLVLPEKLHRLISDTAIRIERTYEALDFTSLPLAVFEKESVAGVF